jgi:hypothetical protein
MHEVFKTTNGGVASFTFKKPSDENTTLLQTSITGSGAITGTVTWTQSIDGIGYTGLAVQALTGTDSKSETLNVYTNAPLIKAEVSNLSASTNISASLAA